MDEFVFNDQDRVMTLGEKPKLSKYKTVREWELDLVAWKSQKIEELQETLSASEARYAEIFSINRELEAHREREHKLILSMKDEISSLKVRNDRLEKKLLKRKN